jgi:hypothetical protein
MLLLLQITAFSRIEACYLEWNKSEIFLSIWPVGRRVAPGRNFARLGG